MKILPRFEEIFPFRYAPMALFALYYVVGLIVAFVTDDRYMMVFPIMAVFAGAFFQILTDQLREEGRETLKRDLIAIETVRRRAMKAHE